MSGPAWGVVYGFLVLMLLAVLLMSVNSNAQIDVTPSAYSNVPGYLANLATALAPFLALWQYRKQRNDDSAKERQQDSKSLFRRALVSLDESYNLRKAAGWREEQAFKELLRIEQEMELVTLDREILEIFSDMVTMIRYQKPVHGYDTDTVRMARPALMTRMEAKYPPRLRPNTLRPDHLDIWASALGKLKAAMKKEIHQ